MLSRQEMTASMEREKNKGVCVGFFGLFVANTSELKGPHWR